MTEHERRALEQVREMLAPLTVYTVEKILGMGGAGYVLKVRHRVFGDRAMKLVHPNLLRSQIIRARFDTEARIMHELTHPNVVKVHDLGEVGDFPYIVMDFLEGGTLEDHLDEFGAMPPKQAVRVAVAILRGLQTAHDKGIVHRDIKPQNILFALDGTPKITDFGIAHVEEGTRSMTREGATIGTFAYMPPEQLSGELDLIGPTADICALGVTLYTMLTCGKLGQEAFFRQIEDHPERLDSVPEILQMVIRMATAQMPEDRFSTAAEMADELESYLYETLPDDPEGTPALGSAPAHAQPDPPAAPAAPTPRMGVTLAPGETHVHDGGYAVSSSYGLDMRHLSVVPSDRVLGTWSDPDEREDEPSVGTITPDGLDPERDNAQVADIRQVTTRRFYRWIVPPVTVFVLVSLVGVGVWFATRPVPIEKVEPFNKPVMESIVEPVVEPVTTAEADILPTLTTKPDSTSVEPPQAPTPEPTSAVVKPSPTPATVVKPTPTPKAVVRPPPEKVIEAPVRPTGQVRLILKSNTTATVTLTGDGGTFTLTGGSHDVPQGTYRVSVDMPDLETPQTGTLTVTPGLTTMTCDSRFKRCTGLK